MDIDIRTIDVDALNVTVLLNSYYYIKYVKMIYWTEIVIVSLTENDTIVTKKVIPTIISSCCTIFLLSYLYLNKSNLKNLSC